MNVEGVKVLCVDYELEDDGTINEIALEKEFGGETGKLVLEPIGLQVVEYLERHFMDLFNYDYTKKLEDELDAISQGNKVWNEFFIEDIANIQPGKRLTKAELSKLPVFKI